MLDRINKEVRSAIQVKQWRNTSSVLEWFSNLQNKNDLTFMMFDIVEYYPSISSKLLEKSLKWAAQYTKISDIEYKTIMHARKSLLFDNHGIPWYKTNTTNAFDVTMGSYDGAEICDLVGLLILHTIRSKTHINNVGLYRDDGLVVLKKFSGSEADKERKSLIKIFKEFNLKITVNTNLKSINFLDVTLNLTDGIHKPYRKPNDTTLYVSKHSNHPPAIIKQIPNIVSDRISQLSSNKEIFLKAAPYYNKALSDSNYTETIEYKPKIDKNTTSKKKTRSRKILWFNPPYGKNVKTEVGKIFIKLIKKHFPKDNKYYKLFNSNTVKVSYSCMNNVESIIKSHNVKIIKEKIDQETNKTECNCKKPDECPLNGKCLSSNSVVYEATVKTINANKKYIKKYIGLTGGNFKERYRNHKKSFQNEKYKKETELSKYIWGLKQKKIQYTVTWKILKTSNTTMRPSGQCNLCMDEKLALLKYKNTGILNKRNELLSTCRHSSKRQRNNVFT